MGIYCQIKWEYGYWIAAGSGLGQVLRFYGQGNERCVLYFFILRCCQDLRLYSVEWYDGLHFFFYLCRGTFGTAATTGLLYQPG
jgi:hypothetical protein